MVGLFDCGLGYLWHLPEDGLVLELAHPRYPAVFVLLHPDRFESIHPRVS